MPPDLRAPAPSIIHCVRDRWPAQLRAQALNPPAVDRQAVLEYFRRHSAYYRDRIGSARHWEDIPPLEKADLADVPVAAGPDLKDARSSGTSGVQITIRNTRIERLTAQVQKWLETDDGKRAPVDRRSFADALFRELTGRPLPEAAPAELVRSNGHADSPPDGPLIPPPDRVDGI